MKSFISHRWPHRGRSFGGRRLHAHRDAGRDRDHRAAGRPGGAGGSRTAGYKSKTAAIQIADLDKSLELFKLDVGRYPTNAEGLQALVTQPASANGWNGLVPEGGLPADPWGNPYHCANLGPGRGLGDPLIGRRQCPGWRGRERGRPQQALSPMVLSARGARCRRGIAGICKRLHADRIAGGVRRVGAYRRPGAHRVRPIERVRPIPRPCVPW